MKIVNNKTKHGIYVNGVILVPGSNPLDNFDETTAQVKAFVESEDLEIKESEKMTEKEQQAAINNANTATALEKLAKTFKKADASKQRKKLEDFDKAVKEAESNDK